MSEIWDCIMLFNEIDMLELRLNILNSVVDHFVIVEAEETHSGNPKRLNFLDNHHRFENFGKKVIYLNAGILSEHVQGNWERERYHRSYIRNGLIDAKPDDFIIVSDCDEIPNPEVVAQIKSSDIQAAKLEMQMYYYDMNHIVRQGWAVGMYRKWIESDPNKIRTCAGYNPTQFMNAGWHFSWFGGPQAILDKQMSFMHSSDPGIRDMPRDQAWIEQRVKDSGDLFDRPGFVIDHVPTDDSLPRYVLNNLDKYRELGWVE